MRLGIPKRKRLVKRNKRHLFASIPYRIAVVDAVQVEIVKPVQLLSKGADFRDAQLVGGKITLEALVLQGLRQITRKNEKPKYKIKMLCWKK
jgi:hypothetical protein